MHKVSTAQLTSGLVLASDLIIDDKVLVPKFKILDSNDIKTIKKYFKSCQVFSLREIKPAIINNSSFSSNYINFLANKFNLLFSSVFNNKSEFELFSKYLAKELSYNREVLFSLIKLRSNHCYTYEHSTNVSLLSLEVGYCLGLSDEEIHSLVLGSILHDIGKLRIDNKILNKPSKLTVEEFDNIKQHPLIGVDLANNLNGVNQIVMHIIKEHHEKLDGSGYPNKLLDKQIHPLSKIVTVCDMYDAITSKRSYHNANTYEKCARILCNDVKDGKLDSCLVQILLSKTVMYPIDTYVRLSNGISGFVVVEDSKFNRPIIYDCINKNFYDLRSLKGVNIVYAV